MSARMPGEWVDEEEIKVENEVSEQEKILADEYRAATQLYVNNPVLRRMGAPAIARIANNATKARIAVASTFPNQYNFLHQPNVTIFDEHTAVGDGHFWIALGSVEEIRYIMNSRSAIYIIEVLQCCSPLYLARFGRWKKWNPIGFCSFPDVALECPSPPSIEVFCGFFTQWLINLQSSLANSNYRLRFTAGENNKVVVELDD